MGSLLFVIGLMGFLFLGLPLILMKSDEAKKRQEFEQKEKMVTNIYETACKQYSIVIDFFEIGHPDFYFVGDKRHDGFYSGANSAGGWSCHMGFTLTGPKTAKYVYFNTVALNAVGDESSVAFGSPRHTLRMTGPIEMGSRKESTWENFIYSYDMKTLRILSIDVDYMDGTSETFKGGQIGYLAELVDLSKL